MAFRNILVPVDFGDSSRAALDLALDLAKTHGSTLTLLHTWEIPVYGYGGMEFAAIDMLTPIEQAAREELDRWLADAKKQQPQATAILTRGVAWREILSAVEQSKPDLVVMGTHGRRGISHALVGSVAEKIVRMSPAPVLTVRAQPR